MCDFCFMKYLGKGRKDQHRNICKYFCLLKSDSLECTTVKLLCFLLLAQDIWSWGTIWKLRSICDLSGLSLLRVKALQVILWPKFHSSTLTSRKLSRYRGSKILSKVLTSAAHLGNLVKTTNIRVKTFNLTILIHTLTPRVIIEASID